MFKGLSRLFTLLIVFLSSFQLAFAETITRLPSSINHSMTIDELFEELEEFGTFIKGEKVSNDCDMFSQQNVQDDEASNIYESSLFGGMNEVPASTNTNEDYYSSTYDFQKNACSQSTREYKSQNKSSQSLNKDCFGPSQEGLLDQIAAQALEQEQNGEEIQVFEVMDSEARELHQRAEKIKGSIRLYLQDRNIDVELKQDLLIEYLDYVLMPMRDLIVLKKSYAPNSLEYDGQHYYQSLTIEFPAEILEQGRFDIEDVLTMGPNPSADPFYLKIVDQGWGRFRVEFNEIEIISRDILTLMKSPTANNYLKASQFMTLQMMLSQIFIYDSMLGHEGATDVPKSCRANINNDLPEQIQFSFSEGRGEEFIEGILAEHGLIYDGDNYEYIEYYMENISRDPTKDGYSGLLPFEEYRNAKQGLDRRSRFNPSIDDMTHFENVLNLKMPKVQSNYTGKTSGGRSRSSKTYTYKDIELLEKVISQPQEMTVYEIIDENGYSAHVDPSRQNLSTYLIEVMQRQGALSVDDVISDNLRNKLENQKVSIDFPALYGSAIWRTWGMQTLKEYIEQNLEEQNLSRNFTRAINNSCRRAMTPRHGGPPGANPNLRNNVGQICNAETASEKAQNVANYLNEFHFDNPYIPSSRVDESQLENVYPFLSELWGQLRDRTNFIEAKPYELDFLLDQMRAQNPWARIRLSYLIAMDEMKSQKEGFEPTYRNTRRGSRPERNTSCFYENIDGQIERLSEAAKELGVDRPLHPGHADSILSRSEKKYIWEDHLEQSHDANSQLFTVQASDGQNYYAHMEELSFRTLLNRESVDKAVADIPTSLYPKDREALEQTLDSPLAKQGEIFFEIYKNQGNLETQQELFEDYAKEYGVHSEFSAKLNFLTLNDELKKPLLMSLVRGAAEQRRRDVQDQLHEFCTLEADDFDGFRTMFYMTTKSHNQLNQMAGLPTVPESVMERLEGGFMGLTPGEVRNMKMGLGVAFLAIGAIVIGATCAGLTGGLCAPLSVAMIGAGVGAMGLQLKLFENELDMKLSADEHERQVKAMEELGFATIGSSSNVSRSWFWTAFEATIILPLVGVATRSVTLGSRLAVASAKSVAQKSGRVAFQKGAQRAVQESDVGFARYVLGLDTVSDSFREGYRVGSTQAKKQLSSHLSRAGVPKEQVGRALNQYDSLARLHRQGEISARQFFNKLGKLLSPIQRSLRGVGNMVAKDFSPVYVRESVSRIDSQTAKVVAEYFGNNPHHFKRLLASFGGKRLDKAIATQQRIQSGSTRVGDIPVVGWAVNGIRNMRTADLAKNGAKLRRLQADLAQVPRSGRSLEDFILRNIDDFTDVMMSMPMRKREMPFRFFYMGFPHLGINRVPALAELADGLIVRKFFTARARLVHESLKHAARENLGLPLLVTSESTYSAIKGLDNSIAKASKRMGQKQSSELLTQYRRFQDESFSHLKKTLSNSRHQRVKLASGKTLAELDDNALRSLLFSPSSSKERAIAEVVWEATPTEQLLRTESLDSVAYKAARELSNYRNMDEFEKFLSSLKVITLKRNPAVVDYL